MSRLALPPLYPGGQAHEQVEPDKTFILFHFIYDLTTWQVFQIEKNFGFCSSVARVQAVRKLKEVMKWHSFSVVT